MSEWIDVYIYAAFIVAVWGCLAPRSSRLTIPVIVDRNPEWAADHPEIEQRFARRRWFRWSCLLWGAISLLALFALQVGIWPQQLPFVHAARKWEALKDLNSALLIVGLIFVAGCALLFYRWLDANVPVSPRRQATLERRSLHDHVPEALQDTVYALIVVHLTLWMVVGITGRYATSAFWGGLAFQFAISGVVLLFVMRAVRRKPDAMDRIFGTGYRQMEVRVAFVAQLLPLLNGFARLYEQVSGPPPENVDRLLHLGLVLLVGALAVALAVWPRRPGEGRARWPRSAASTGALG